MAQQRTRSMSIQPPVMGWNTKDPVSMMDPSYAVEMENYFPNGATVDLRKGSVEFASLTDQVFSMAEYVSQGSTRYLIAFTDNGNVINATAGGAGTDIDGGVSFGANAGGEVYTANFRDRLFMKANESTTDVYTWNASGNISAAAFTGPSGDDKDLWRIAPYKNRLYFIERFSASMWYGGLDSITGTLTEFDFQSLFTRGGRLYYIGGFSVTASSVSEYFVAISETGEVLLYQGDHPGNSTWSKVGHYYLAAPIGRRSFFNWGNDIVIITKVGAVSLTDVINATGRSEYSYLSDKISPTFKESIHLGPNPQVVSGIEYPNGPFILINASTATGTGGIGLDGANQFIMNTTTRAWCKFTGLNANCWCLFNNDLYLGRASGKIVKVDTGYHDEDTFIGGGAIASRTVKLRPAYNYFGNRETVKQFVSAIPTLYESEGLSLTLDADVDFANTTATSTVTDTTDTSYKLYQPVMGLNGIGQAASIRMDGTVTTKRRSLQAIKVIWNEGDLL
jgi:hypothetical protein